MKSTKSYRTGKADVDRVLAEIARDINILCDSVNAPQQSVGYGATGKSGDLRLTFDDGGYAYIEGYGKNGWMTTFTGVMKDKPARGRPNPHFPYLEVDNFYAKIFTVAMTTARTGNEIMSDFGIVESMTNNTITFKDQSNLNLCSFAVGDTCEVRHIKADKSANIKKINFTVTAVNGRTVTVTYSAGDKVSVGDIVVRIGNTTTAARQKAIYFSTADNTNVPYIDLYAGTTGYTFGTPKASFGDLTHIADSDFNSTPPYLLTGDGIYCANAYIKGKIIMTNQGSIQISGFSNDAGFITSGDIPPIPQSFYQSSEPTTMVTGDFWFDTSVAGQYKMKRYNGTSWATSPVVSVYMDANGVYAGNITAGQITAGTLTGFTIQTATSGQRVVMDNTNTIKFYGSGNQLFTMYSTGSWLFLDGTFLVGNLSSRQYLSFGNGFGADKSTDNGLTWTTVFQTTNNGWIYGTALGIGSDGTGNNVKFSVNSSGQLIKVNNISATSGFVLAGDGTSFTPTSGYATQSWVNGEGYIKLTSLNATTPIAYNNQTGTIVFLGDASNRTVSDAQISIWTTAYNWGNHASAGYITSAALTWANISGKPYSSFGTASQNATGDFATAGHNHAGVYSLVSHTHSQGTINYKDHDGFDQTIQVLIP